MNLKNREIQYDNFVEYIEHLVGKKVLTYKRLPERHATIFLFTDHTSATIDEGVYVANETIKLEPIPKSFCASCGEDMHAGIVDYFGRCEITLKNFWKKARKVYWHRYSKSK